MSEPADSKTDPGFENCPRFEGVIEQNKIQRTYDHDCIMITFAMHPLAVPSIASEKEVLSQAGEQNDRASNKPRIRKESIPL